MEKENVPTKGGWNVFWSGADRPTMRYEILGFTPETGQWRWSREKALEAINNYELYLKEFSQNLSLEEYWGKTGQTLKFIRKIQDGVGKNGGVQYWLPPSATSLRTSNWTDIEVSQIHKEFDLPFENPKSTKLINTLIDTIDGDDFIVLDFFSGSATTAHSILQSNANNNGNRKYILVQIPENTDEKSEAKKAGYNNICDIGKERIRRAGSKIKEDKLQKAKKEGMFADFNDTQDYGVRVYRLDESNMQEVYYKPQDYNQSNLELFADNIKPDRTSDDLLAQIILDWGLPLNLKIETMEINGKQVYKVASNSLYACFANNIDEEFAKEVAKKKPLRIVFKDSGFKDDTAKTNVKQLLKQISPETEMKVI
jgi:adenine-specific DNA-methyltransferase